MLQARITSPRLTYEKEIGNGEKVWIFDDVMAMEELLLVYELIDGASEYIKFVHEVLKNYYEPQYSFE